MGEPRETDVGEAREAWARSGCRGVDVRHGAGAVGCPGPAAAPQDFPFIVLVFIGIPAAALLNTAEFKLICAMGARSVGWLTSFDVSIITRAANMLPIPGGAITRTAAMCSEGISAKLATTLVGAFLVSWMGAKLLY